jgi:uncharacterized 2Fe-2S/4Fe-4S cluster protein (DUF4445 family)
MASLQENYAAIRLTVESAEGCVVLPATAGNNLLEVLRAHRVYVNSPCGGKGTCGKCRITVLTGTLAVNETGAGVSKFASAGKTALACRAQLINDCTIDITQLQERDFVGEVDFPTVSTVIPNTDTETIRFIPTEGCWTNGCSLTETICAHTDRHLTFAPKALRQLSAWMSESLATNFTGPEASHPIYLTIRNNRVLLIRRSELEPVYGVGVDIGTTTLAFALVNLENGEVCSTLSRLNSQRQYGADVISRIQKSSDGFLETLQDCIRNDIIQGVLELCGQSVNSVVRMVIAGNTTMLHLLLGVASASLAQYPFIPVMTDSLEIGTTELLGVSALDCEATLLPAAGAFIGADILAGLIYCDMNKPVGISLFIDVGTNGEMAISGKEKLLGASTAAGPAFEGANITCGIGSIPGAISSFDLLEGQIKFRTIGNESPVGLCGSAVIDIVAACLRAGLIDRTGRFLSAETGSEGFPITQTATGEWIKFYQKDVREFQLAKSAIRAGIEVLMREYGCCPEDIEQVFLAGGFGTRMDARNALEVGLFPPEFQGKIKPMGNTALAGTIHYLLESKSQQSIELLAHSTTVIDLSKHPSFNDLFMEQLHF